MSLCTESTQLRRQQWVQSLEAKTLKLKDAGTPWADLCEHEQAKMHCPQTCGLCAALGAQEDMMNRRQLDKCAE